MSLNILVVITHVLDSFSQRKTDYLAHIYEPKTKSANFVEGIQMHFQYHSIRMNITLIHIILLTHFRPMFHLYRNQLVGFY